MKYFILVITLISFEPILGESAVREVTRAELHEEYVKVTNIASYSVKNVTLDKALEILMAKCQIAWKGLPARKTPQEFKVIGDAHEDIPKVTLTIKDTSLKLILMVLAEQSKTVIVYKDTGVYLDAHVDTD